MKGFQTCGRNLEVIPNMEFAHQFFSPLHRNFQTAWTEGRTVTCLLIQSLITDFHKFIGQHSNLSVVLP